ncbi:MAG: hypothetical protein ACXQTE_05965 [Methanosarcinaceae archaeon]
MKQPIHTTIDPETHRYIKRMQSEHDLHMNQVIDWLVDQQKKRDRGLESRILKEVVNQVLADYYHRSLVNTPRR